MILNNLKTKKAQFCQLTTKLMSQAKYLTGVSCKLHSKPSPSHQENFYNDENDHNENLVVKSNESKIQKSCNSNPDFPDVIKEYEVMKTFSELVSTSKVLKGVGRLCRVMLEPERIDNMWESSVEKRQKKINEFNLYQEEVKEKAPSLLSSNNEANIQENPYELGVAKLVLRLGGAIKLVGADRWVDDFNKFKIRSRRDTRRFGTHKVDALDFRGTCLNYEGIRFFDKLAYIRYLNVGDCREFDDFCLARLNHLCDSLEYIDVSGTKITAEGLSYLRLFSNLKWINLSRTNQGIYDIIPYILEILPHNCTVVVDDDRPALSYGSQVPYLHPSNPDKDWVFEEDPGLGDVVLFEERYGSEVFNPADVSHVHQLWKTPEVSGMRQMLMRKHNVPLKSVRHTVLKHVKEAEKLPPLF